MKKKKIILVAISIILSISIVAIYLAYSTIYKSNVKEDSYLYIKTNDTSDSVYTSLSVHLQDVSSFKLVSELNNINSLEKLAGKISIIIEPDSTELIKAFRDLDFINKSKFRGNTAILMYIPNTYHFRWNTSASKFRDRMLYEYNQYWNEKRLDYAKNKDLTPIEVGVLASIVQKESSFVSERKTIAGLYLNRLDKNWKLQADPTVIYAVKKARGEDFIIKRVLNKDLSISSPYNTYTVNGLPPGPISMPDISSIESVLHSENHKYMYMCASIDKIGTHAFAKTLSAHLVNARIYQRWLSKQGVNR